MYQNLTNFELLTLQQERHNFYLAIIVATISFISAILIYLDYRSRKDKERAEKSIKIAEDFASKIIIPISIISVKFREYGIDAIVNNKVNFMQFCDFDKEELDTLYSSEDIEDYIKLINQNDVDHKLHILMRNTLNTLEYMCMNICTGVSDEKYIYNSLHQQFLKAIASLYFEISMINIDNKDKYYTNIIQVYDMWKTKYIHVAEKEKKLKEQTKKEQEKLRKQAKRCEEKLESNKKKLKKMLTPKTPKSLS